MIIAASDGTGLSLQDEGTGPPVLFLHEYAGDDRSWAGQVLGLADRFRCIVLSARGYPPSDVPTDPEAYSQDIADRDALAVLDSLDIESAHVVGLSMGAYTALRLALRWPDRVASVTAASGGSGSYKPTRDRFIAATLGLADDIEAVGTIPAESFGEGPTRIQLRIKNPEAWRRFVDHLSEHPPAAAAMTLRGIQASRPSLYDMEDALRRLDRPVLLMVGDEDDPCLDVNLWMKRTMPSARLIVMPGTGHMINLEEPAAFNSAVTAFIDSVENGIWRPRDPLAMVEGYYGASKN